MSVVECPVDSIVEVAVVDLVRPHTRESSGDLRQLAAQVFTLLVGTLGGRGEGGELCVDLVQEFGEFAEVEGSGLVLVILFEELV